MLNICQGLFLNIFSCINQMSTFLYFTTVIVNSFGSICHHLWCIQQLIILSSSFFFANFLESLAVASLAETIILFLSSKSKANVATTIPTHWKTRGRSTWLILKGSSLLSAGFCYKNLIITFYKNLTKISNNNIQLLT